MINGINSFKEYFKDHSDSYVIIGGCACDLLFDNAGGSFRLTKDVDMVLIAEVLSSDFISKFWDYIKLGEYEHVNNSTRNPQFYRFSSPKDNSFPSIIELFSRKPDLLTLDSNAHITPIPVDDELSSLSAILLDDNYYNLLVNGKTKVNDISIIDVPQLIALKAKAWLDLSELKANKIAIHSNDIKKHKRDVLRLSQLLTPETKKKVAPAIIEDFNKFLDEAYNDNYDPKVLNINASLSSIIERLRSLFEA